MNNRLKIRPKSSAASTLAKSGQLNYISMRGPDCWRTEPNGALWGSDSSLLGIKGSKYTPQPWQVSLGPQSGGFLPVLKNKPRPSTGLRKISKRSRLNAPSQSSDTSGGKIISTNTASLLDLNTIVPSGKKSVVKLYRENSLPANFHVLPQPVLRYSHENNVDLVLSKLDLFDGAKSTENDSTNSNSLSTSINQLDTELPTEDIQEPSLTPAPPPSPKKQSVARFNNITTILATDASTELNDDISDSKWKLNVLIPNNTNTDEEHMSDENNTSSDEIDTIKDFNNPKSILKLQNELDQPSELPNRKQLGVSSYLLTTPLPPSVRPANAAVITNKKRVTRNKQASLVTNPIVTDSSIDDASESDKQSGDNEHDSTTTDTSCGKPVDEPKSVRFSEQPVKVKEYYPWEAPQHSIVHAEPKPPPKPIKSNPVFRP